jgi:hypothetical protein
MEIIWAAALGDTLADLFFDKGNCQGCCLLEGDTRSKCQTDNVKRLIQNWNSINPLYRVPSTNATGARVSNMYKAVVWFLIVPWRWRDFALRDIEHQRSKNLETNYVLKVKLTMLEFNQPTLQGAKHKCN